jgi:hypothetical protein
MILDKTASLFGVVPRTAVGYGVLASRIVQEGWVLRPYNEHMEALCTLSVRRKHDCLDDPMLTDPARARVVVARLAGKGAVFLRAHLGASNLVAFEHPSHFAGEDGATFEIDGRHVTVYRTFGECDMRDVTTSLTGERAVYAGDTMLPLPPMSGRVVGEVRELSEAQSRQIEAECAR